MTKQPVKKTPKAKTVKKTKAKQIIKQKVVVNVAAPPRRRGRPRKSSESEKRGPVPKGETILTSKASERQYYDAERAGKKYADEMKKELLQLKADAENETKKQLGMQQQALLMQMYQGQPRDISYYEPPQITFLEDVPDDIPEEEINVEREKAQKAALKLAEQAQRAEANRLKAEEAVRKLANKQASAAKAREARKRMSDEKAFMAEEEKASRQYETALKQQEMTARKSARIAGVEAAKKASEREAAKKAAEEKAQIEAAKAAAKAERAANRAVKKAQAEAQAKALAEAQAKADAEKAAKKAAGAGSPSPKKGRKGKNK